MRQSDLYNNIRQPITHDSFEEDVHLQIVYDAPGQVEVVQEEWKEKELSDSLKVRSTFTSCEEDCRLASSPSFSNQVGSGAISLAGSPGLSGIQGAAATAPGAFQDELHSLLHHTLQAISQPQQQEQERAYLQPQTAQHPARHATPTIGPSVSKGQQRSERGSASIASTDRLQPHAHPGRSSNQSLLPGPAGCPSQPPMCSSPEAQQQLAGVLSAGQGESGKGARRWRSAAQHSQHADGAGVAEGDIMLQRGQHGAPGEAERSREEAAGGASSGFFGVDEDLLSAHAQLPRSHIGAGAGAGGRGRGGAWKRERHCDKHPPFLLPLHTQAAVPGISARGAKGQGGGGQGSPPGRRSQATLGGLAPGRTPARTALDLLLGPGRAGASQRPDPMLGPGDTAAHQTLAPPSNRGRPLPATKGVAACRSASRPGSAGALPKGRGGILGATRPSYSAAQQAQLGRLAVRQLLGQAEHSAEAEGCSSPEGIDALEEASEGEGEGGRRLRQCQLQRFSAGQEQDGGLAEDEGMGTGRNAIRGGGMYAARGAQQQVRTTRIIADPVMPLSASGRGSPEQQESWETPGPVFKTPVHQLRALFHSQTGTEGAGREIHAGVQQGLNQGGTERMDSAGVATNKAGKSEGKGMSLQRNFVATLAPVTRPEGPAHQRGVARESGLHGRLQAIVTVEKVQHAQQRDDAKTRLVVVERNNEANLTKCVCRVELASSELAAELVGSELVMALFQSRTAREVDLMPGSVVVVRQPWKLVKMGVSVLPAMLCLSVQQG